MRITSNIVKITNNSIAIIAVSNTNAQQRKRLRRWPCIIGAATQTLLLWTICSTPRLSKTQRLAINGAYAISLKAKIRTCLHAVNL